MFKLLSHSVIALILVLGFAPVIKSITISEANNLYTQATITDEEKLATANRLYQEGLALYKKGTKESLLEAIAKFEQAVPLYQAVKSSSEEALTLFLIGQVYNYLGESENALDYYDQALAIHLAISNKVGQAYTLNNIGKIYSDLGEQKKALDYYNQALNLHRAVTNPSGEATALKNIGDAYNNLGKKEKALNYYNQVLPIYRELDDLSQEANTLYDIGDIYNSLAEKQEAFNYYEQALLILQELKNYNGIGFILNNMGLVSKSLGEMEKALDYYNQSLTIFQELKNLNRQATNLNNIGKVYDLLGKKQEALDYFNEALSISQGVDDKNEEALTLSNLGLFYDELGEKQTALDYYAQALTIYQVVKDLSGEGRTLNNIGKVYKDLGEKQKALDYFDRALSIFQAIKYPTGEATTFTNIGAAYQDIGKKKKALNYYKQALSIFREIKYLSGEATTLNNIGVVYDELKENETALDFYNQALPISRLIGDRALEANTLYSIAFVYYKNKNYDTALQNVDQAIEIIEQIRSTIVSSDLKSSYLATVEDYYKAKIKILMKLHQQNPNLGYDILAFETGEQGKARSLLELLQEANIDIRQGVSSDLVTQEKQLQNKLDAVEQRRINLCNRDCSDRLINNLETERGELLEQYKTIQSKIRVSSPEYAKVTQTEPIKLKQLQQLLDEDTVLWQYSLGKDRSYIWVITKDSFITSEIASREEIETVAREYHKLLQYKSRDKKLNYIATKLSQLIISSTTETQVKSRIVIVADGALQYIPFSTLPLENERSLLNNYQIINLPSSSVLERLRANETQTKSNKKQLAILADPVFSSTDSRLPRQQAEDTADLGYDPLRSATRSSDLRLSRLVGTKKEAETIAAYLPESQQTSVFGFDANLEFATSPELSNYNIIHFATHGILNSEQPELSGIVLSLFDAQGKPQNGFLRLHEIFNLNLTADLVVLSACQTGLGKEIRGEGLVGLTRGFMYAGANKVLVSLWNVDDAATAEFMKQFYNFMLQDKLSPASALNATQRYMQNHDQWSHPYYWAAFTLQGDWGNR